LTPSSTELWSATVIVAGVSLVENNVCAVGGLLTVIETLADAVPPRLSVSEYVKLAVPAVEARK